MRLKGAVFFRVAILVTVLTVFVAGTLAVFSINHHRDQTKKLHISQADLLGHEVLRSLLWDDRVNIKALFSDLVESEKVIDYVFLTVEGKPVVWTLAHGVPKILLGHSYESSESATTWEFQNEWGTVFYDIAVPLSQSSAVLHIGLNQREVDKGVVPLLKMVAFHSGIALVIGYVLAFFLARRAVQEVEALARSVHSWADGGDWSGNEPELTSLEVADLAETFKELCSVRRQAERTILEQNEFLNNIIAALSHPLYVIDVDDYSVRLANPAARALNVEEGMSCYAATHDRSTPCDGVDHPCPLEMVKASGKPVTVDHIHFDGNSELRHFEIHGFPVLDDDGRVKQMIEYTLDVTKRQNAEDSLRVRNRELALLNWVIGAAASGMERDEVLHTACRELSRALGVDRVAAAMLNESRTEIRVVAECVNRNLQSMLGASIRVEKVAPIRAIFETRCPVVVWDVATDSRFEAVRPLFLRTGVVSILMVPLVVDDRIEGVIGLGTAERRDFPDDFVALTLSVAGQLSSSLALAQVNLTRRRLMTVIEQTRNSVLMTDIEGNIVYVNPAFEKVSGYNNAEVIGKNPRFVKSGVHDRAFYEEMWSTITAGEVWRGRITNKKKDGSIFVSDASITPVRSDDGVIINFVAVNRDVTREIELEEQFLQAQKMEGIGRLAGGIAHDFNNILGVIMGNAELTMAQLEEENPHRESLGEIVAASEQAARLTRQLLIFARRQPQERVEVQLNNVIMGYQRMFWRLIGEDIVIETTLKPDLPPVWGNPSRFEQVLLNLVVNARDAMPSGGRLTIQTEEVWLDRETARHLGGVAPGNYVCLTVMDTGTGMSEEVRRQAFEPFFTTKERTRGTGLGLSTCYGIVTEIRGHIEVESSIGHGTCVRVFVPVEHRGMANLPTQRADGFQGSLQGKETILIAEDDESVRSLASRTLRDLGYSVLEAADGEEARALGKAYDGTIDLLVTDVLMPHMRGPDLAASLLQELPDIKILFISGFFEQSLDSGDFGDAVLLQKPFKPVDLARQVRALLDG